MKNTFVNALSLSFLLLTPALSSDTEFEQEAPSSFSASGDFAALDAPAFSVSDIDEITRKQLCQKFLYGKITANKHTPEEGERFLILTKQLQDLGQEMISPQVQGRVTEQKAKKIEGRSQGEIQHPVRKKRSRLPFFKRTSEFSVIPSRKNFN